jgi:hypothetical protein
MFRISVSVLAMLLCLTPVHASDGTGGYAIIGAGGKSCGAFSPARKVNSVEELVFSAWLGGFISGGYLYEPATYDISGSTDFQGMLRWLDRTDRNEAATQHLRVLHEARAAKAARLGCGNHSLPRHHGVVEPVVGQALMALDSRVAE